MPLPPAGKVATFSLAKLSTKYDVDQATGNQDMSQAASDASGNVYMLSGSGPEADVLRMTPGGTVRKVARLGHVTGVRGIAPVGNGDLVVGGFGGLYRVDRHGTAERLNTRPLTHPAPIGTRPDGSVVVVDGGTVWSFKGAAATKLYEDHTGMNFWRGAVDATGAVYIASGGSLKGTLVLAPGRKPRAVAPRGTVPGTHTPLSALVVQSMTAAQGGGYYAKVVTDPDGDSLTPYVVRVGPTGSGTVLARGTLGKSSPSCVAGKQYPALTTQCRMPWFVVQSGKRLLVMGSPSPDGSRIPAFAIRADTK
ncbi:SMP-30/gluconolactonase/LRE family protein [Streptomyces tubercidicus]|uniref:hypothetical protein n=1 Tax=Streptomyces tubercidicus TaxID=47759 RepID=UPI0036C0662C